jgi:CRISPR-associated protein Csb3
MQFKLQLDVYNPAEYYACLGLLELFSEHDADTVAHFESDGSTGEHSTFICQGNIRMPDLRAIKVVALPFRDAGTAPVVLDNKFELNWWLNQYRTEKLRDLKLWTGASNPHDMLRTYQAFMGPMDEGMLQHSIMTKRGKSSFGFDTRASRDALEIGYSQKQSGDASVLYPATEFLCAIGLQNFRPFRVGELTYFVWWRPVPICIAHGAAVQEIPGLKQDAYKISIGFVGQGLRAVDKVTRIYANLGLSAAG